MDYVSNSVMMPLIALLSTILIGWVKSPKYVADEMERGGYKFRRKRVLYYVMIRYVAPVMMLVLFLQSTGLLSMIFLANFIGEFPRERGLAQWSFAALLSAILK